MLTKTGAALIAAVVVASASGATAQSLMGDGIPSDAYGRYERHYGPQPYGYNPYAGDSWGPTYVPREHSSRRHSGDR